MGPPWAYRKSLSPLPKNAANRDPLGTLPQWSTATDLFRMWFSISFRYLKSGLGEVSHSLYPPLHVFPSPLLCLISGHCSHETIQRNVLETRITKNKVKKKLKAFFFPKKDPPNHQNLKTHTNSWFGWANPDTSFYASSISRGKTSINIFCCGTAPLITSEHVQGHLHRIQCYCIDTGGYDDFWRHFPPELFFLLNVWFFQKGKLFQKGMLRPQLLYNPMLVHYWSTEISHHQLPPWCVINVPPTLILKS